MKRLVIIVVLVFSFLVVNSTFAQKGMKRPEKETDLPEVVYHTGWALVIGINKYPYLPSQFQLSYAVADAEAIIDLLQRKFGYEKDRIIVLKDEQATKHRIMEKLNSLADPRWVDKEDCVMIYFSGHGQTVQLPRGGYMGFLIPHDAKVDLSQEPNLAEYKQSCIAMNELNDAAKTIPAKHIVFLVDACYSGLVLGAHKGLSSKIPGYLKKVAKAPTQQMITAGGKGEESEERPDLGHGVFTYKLIKGLEDEIADENDDGVITGTELSSYITNAVLEMTDGKQSPQFGRADEGEFLFIPQMSLGRLEIEVDPTDATVTVTSPDTSAKPHLVSVGETELPVGIYQVTAEKDGYETLIRDQVKITDSVPTRLKLTLKPRMATIIGQDLPGGTRVLVNGSPVTLPYVLAPGTYRIRLERDGFNPVDMTEALKPAQVYSPNPVWVPAIAPTPMGTLQVQVEPADAKVSVTSVDTSERFDLGAMGEIKLPSGTYVITAKKDGYETGIQNVRVTANARTQVPLALKQVRMALATISAEGLSLGTRVFINDSPATLPYQVAPGSYRIRLERDGFKPVETLETLTSAQVLSLSPKWESLTVQKGIPRIGAFAASMVVPGLGQHLQRHRARGLIYEGLILSMGVVAIGATIYHQNTLDNYFDVRDQLEAEANGKVDLTPALKDLFDEQEDSYNRAKSARSLAIASQAVFAVVWGINALDAGILTRPAQQRGGVTFETLSNGGTLIARLPF